jgi:hypothetical protein
MNFIRQIASRSVLAGLLLLAFTAGAHAQSGRLGRIAILPFSGGTEGEREGVPELFMATQEIMNGFSVISRTGITEAVQQEQSFQATSGMTDADTIARLGEQFGADYVMAGSITSLGGKNLLIVSIIKIDDIRQVAGVSLVYDSLSALITDKRIVAGMAAELVEMARSAGGGLEMLSVVPVLFGSGANKEEGDSLAQLLAINLLKAGKYAVYPRTESLDQVKSEYETQLLGGVTRPEEAVKAGRAVNPPYVLSVISRKIGTLTIFNASIIDIKTGESIDTRTEEYANMSDGMNAMRFLAMILSGQKVSDADRSVVDKENTAEARAAENAEKARIRAAAADDFLKKSGMVFSGWLGYGIGETTGIKQVPDESGSINDVKYKTNTGILGGGGTIELWYRYFAIQTGIAVITEDAPYTPPGGEKQYAKLSFIQIPLLACIDISGPELPSLLVFGGLGLNAAVVSISDAESADPGRISLIFGGGFGYRGKDFGYMLGYQWNGGLGGASLTVDGASYDYTRSSHIFSLTVGYYLPFRK